MRHPAYRLITPENGPLHSLEIPCGERERGDDLMKGEEEMVQCSGREEKNIGEKEEGYASVKSGRQKTKNNR
jgi:hypothetical protein